MEITTDVLLRGSTWKLLSDKLGEFFKPRTNYDLFILALSVGIMYDKKIERADANDLETDTAPLTVPRTVLQNNDAGKLDFMFQAIVLSTRTENFTEEQRLELAFGEKVDINKLAFLTQFANYGATELVKLIGESDIETMENIKNFSVSSFEGRNFEIDNLTESLLVEDIQDVIFK